MKIALSVNEVIAALSKMADPSTEVWIKSSDGVINPCNTVEYDDEKKCVILREERPFDDGLYEQILGAIKKQ